MTQSEIHKLFVTAAIEAAKQGASAKQLADYLTDAAAGMKANAAFCLAGDVLLEALNAESR